ncbi:hypothetical protein D3C80_673450 [compost metagenome]
MGLIFGHDLKHACATDIHLIKRLHGCEAGCTALVDRLDLFFFVRHQRAPFSFSRTAIIVSAARAAKPPLSLSERRARAQA